MEEQKQKIIERPLMSEEEFGDYIEKNRVDIAKNFYEKGILCLRDYNSIGKFKSIRRAIKRGHISLDGFTYPNRPFNNRANTSKSKNSHSRSINERKKSIYEQLRHRQSV